ncbi:5'/3'-nucleotidase SurE [Ectothiorhodospiraceae bacterium WFHF3C12]|nr:5'/3'-nucleotidase SurE [Ectothiorhodospiraceae bacterium WFHF3C12]
MLERPRILLTNDDGARAPGLAVLERIAARLSDDVWVVAPETDQSGTSHSISLHQPLRVLPEGDRRYTVRGTPSDCVLLAMGHLMADHPPDLILSGVNCGANISDSVAYSGTVGAAMTGLLMDIPAIALSQAFFDRHEICWETAETFAEPVIRTLLDSGYRGDVCFNVNFPARPVDQVAGLAFARPAKGSISGVVIEPRNDTREEPYYWLGFQRSPERVQAPDSDVEALRRGRIAVSPLRFDRGIDDSWSGLAAAMGDAVAAAQRQQRS